MIQHFRISCEPSKRGDFRLKHVPTTEITVDGALKVLAVFP
jgi:hypothetical protein